jgi:hypothetical protein
MNNHEKRALAYIRRQMESRILGSKVPEPSEKTLTSSLRFIEELIAGAAPENPSFDYGTRGSKLRRMHHIGGEPVRCLHCGKFSKQLFVIVRKKSRNGYRCFDCLGEEAQQVALELLMLRGA